MVHGESQRSLTQEQTMQDLGINIHMIEDENLISLLQSMSVELEKDDSGNTVIKNVDLNMIATVIMASKLIRTSWVDPIDADIMQLRLKRFMIRQELDMNEDEYELGGTNFNDALYTLLYTAWCDAKNGRKPKLLKVYGKSLEVRVAENKGKGQQGLL